MVARHCMGLFGCIRRLRAYLGHFVALRPFLLGVVAMARETNGQMTIADVGGKTGEYMLKMADDWIAANPKVWADMMLKAAEFVTEGQRFSMERLIQFARYERKSKPGGVFDDERRFKVNNDCRAGMARRMLELHPSWEKYVDIRRSKVDRALEKARREDG